MKDRRRGDSANEDEEALLPDPEKNLQQKHAGRSRWPIVVSFVLNACFALMAGVFVGRYWFLDKNFECTAHVSQNSRYRSLRQVAPLMSMTAPLLDQIDLSYQVVRFNGSFLRENVYRRQASPEVDAAWEALGVNCKPTSLSNTRVWALTKIVPPDRSVIVPESQADQAGFRHDQVKINPKHGGGFPANVEGLHHLHCLVRDILS